MQKAITYGALLLACANAAHAQDRQSIFNAVREIAGAAIQKQNDSGARPDAAKAILGNDSRPVSGQTVQPSGLLFQTKQDFLAAVRRGEFAGYHKTSSHPDGEAMAAMNSFAWILDKEYRTPVPNWDGRNRYAGGHPSDYCIVSEVKAQMHQLLQTITEAKMQTLSNKPPEFQNDRAEDKRPIINSVIQTLRNVCYQSVFGTKKPYPFIDSYIALMEEYASATDEYVTERRAQYKERYQQELARKRAEEEQRAEAARREQTARREQEQRQIEADRRRIEEQERKAKERERNRVAG